MIFKKLTAADSEGSHYFNFRIYGVPGSVADRIGLDRRECCAEGRPGECTGGVNIEENNKPDGGDMSDNGSFSCGMRQRAGGDSDVG